MNDAQEKLNRTGRSALDFAKIAVGVSPLIAAAYYGIGQVRANEAVNNPLATIMGNNAQHELGTAIGGMAKRLTASQQKEHAENFKRQQHSIRQQLEKTDAIHDLFQSVEKKNATLQALAITLDDPAMGLNDTQRDTMKRALQEAAGVHTPDHEKVVSDILRAIVDSKNEDVTKRYTSLVHQFSDIGGQLKAPTGVIPKSGVSYNSLSSPLHQRDQKLVERISKAVGKGHKIETQEYEEFGTRFRVAKVYGTMGGSEKFLTSIPLSAVQNIKGKDYAVRANYFRTGESGRTLMSMPSHMIDAVRGLHIAENPKSTFADLYKRATVSNSEWAVQQLETMTRSGGFRNWTKFRSDLVSVMTDIDRVASTGTAFGAHQRFQEEATRTVGVYNLNKLNKDAPQRAIAAMGSMFPNHIQMGIGNKSMLHRSENGMAGALGVHQGSFFEALQRNFDFSMAGGARAVDRAAIPLSMREFQVVGRSSVFLGNHFKRGNTTFGSLYSAATSIVGETQGARSADGYVKELRQTYQAINPYGELMSGGHVAPTIVDLGGRMHRGTTGSGVGYMGENKQIMQASQFAFLDPKSHGYLQSDIVERLQAAGDAGEWFDTKDLKKLRYLGETANGSKFLPFNEDLERVHLRLAEVTEDKVGSGSKRTISVTANRVSNKDTIKTFGLDHKGTLNVRANVLSVLDDNASSAARAMAGRLGLEERSFDVVNSDMYEKGAIGFMNQIAGGADVVSTGKVTTQALKARAEQIAMNTGEQVFKIHNAGKALYEHHALAHYGQAAMELMAQHGVGVEDIGIVMSGIFHGAGANLAPGQYKQGSFAMDQDSMKVLANSLWSNDPQKAKLFVDTANLGFTFSGRAVKNIGEGPGDWGRARAGIEPRFAKTLQERLGDFGMNTKQASEFVSHIYKNKIGLTEHYTLASQMLKMQSTLVGANTPMDFVRNGDKNRIGWKKLVNEVLGPNNGDNTLAAYLSQQEGGLTLSMHDAPDHIKRAFKEAYPQGELYLPGKEASAASKGAMIKQIGGASTPVDGQLSQLFNGLQSRLLHMNANKEGALESFVEWKKEATGLFTEVFDQLHTGKIKGGTSPYGNMYDLNEGTNFARLKQDPMYKRALETYMQTTATGAQSVHLDTEGFLSQLSDMPNKSKADLRDLSRKAEMFFTTMETGGKRGSQFAGIVGIDARHPLVGPGNVFMTQTFRHLEEVESLGGKDSFFTTLKNSEVGKKMLNEAFTGHDIQSFAHMNAVDSKGGMRKKFFKSLVQNISEFTSGENAGRAYYGSLKTNHGNFGPGTGSWLDFDGDHTIRLMMGKEHSNMLSKHIKQYGGEAARNDIRAKGFFNQMQKQSKGALQTLVEQNQGLTAAERAQYNSIINETNVSINTGSMDINLRGMHDALSNSGLDRNQIENARTVLANLQENFVLKSKKIPTISNYAEQITKSAAIAMESGQMSEFHSVMKEIYGSQAFSQGGIKVQGQVEVADNPEVTEMLRKAMNGGHFDESYHLDQFMSDLGHAVNKSVSDGTNRFGSKGRLAAGLNSVTDARDALNFIHASRTMGAGALESFAGQSVGAKTELAVDAMRVGAGKIGNHMLSPMVLGVLGAATITGMMSGGIAPEPIVMPGEIPTGKLSAGSLFNRKDPNVAPEQLSVPGSQYDNMPGAPGQAYATRLNSYQIRGDVSSSSGLATFGNYFNQLTGGTGRGIVSINDNRMPITRSYVDRLMGF